MASKIREARERIRGGCTARELATEALDALARREGEAAPVPCRNDRDLAEADAIEWRELDAALAAAGLGAEGRERLRRLHDDCVEDSWRRSAGSGGEGEATDPGRWLFDLFAGTPPVAVTGIALSYLNGRPKKPLTGKEADHLDALVRRLESEFPHEDERRRLIEAVSTRPLHAFLRRFEAEDVLRDAEEVDRRLRGAERMPLAGVGLAVKDVLALRQTTAASKILRDYEAPADYVATPVRQLLEAGAIALGKTNLDEFALGSSSESTAYWPAPRNPWDTARVPGGSSGGSAAAVAAGLAIGALGSDTAGSIRVPASYCGVVGVKPTYGLVSRFGLFPLASSLDCVGPMAPTVEDAAILLGHMVGGPDSAPGDNTQRLPPARRGGTIVSPDALYADGLGDSGALERALAGKAVGIPVQYFLDLDLDEEDEADEMVARSENGSFDFAALEGRRWVGEKEKRTHLGSALIGDFLGSLAAEDLKALDDSTVEALWSAFESSPGHQPAYLDKLHYCPSYWDRFAELVAWLQSDYGVRFRYVSLPHTSLSIPSYFVISRYETASNLHRFDGCKYGVLDDAPFGGGYHSEAARNRRELFGTQPKQRILMGIHSLQDQEDDGLFRRAQRARYLIRRDFLRAFERVDLILGPTVNTMAPYFGGFSDTVLQQQMDQFSVPANHAGIPAVSVPFYRGKDEFVASQLVSRPLHQSAQVLAPDFEEARMFRLAAAVERWYLAYGGGEDAL